MLGEGTINAITFCRTMAITGQFTEFLEIARQHREIGVALADRLCGLSRPLRRNDLQRKILMPLGDLVGQRLDEFGVHWTGGDPHMVGFGGKIEARPEGRG